MHGSDGWLRSIVTYRLMGSAVVRLLIWQHIPRWYACIIIIFRRQLSKHSKSFWHSYMQRNSCVYSSPATPLSMPLTLLHYLFSVQCIKFVRPNNQKCSAVHKSWHGPPSAAADAIVLQLSYRIRAASPFIHSQLFLAIQLLPHIYLDIPLLYPLCLLCLCRPISTTHTCIIIHLMCVRACI